MLIALEQARSMAMLATMMAAEDERRASGARRSRPPRCRSAAPARFVGQQAIQLHGGIGMTMEYKVGHYFKRVTMIDTMFGDADYHLGLLAETGGLVAA